MANQGQPDLLRQGAAAWNRWRDKNPEVHPDLHEANLYRMDLRAANLSRANLVKANLGDADLHGADLRAANLRRADLHGADLHAADLSAADLSEADLSAADLRKAILPGADLRQAQLVGTHLEGAILTGCSVYGISAWGLKGEPKGQLQLIISPPGEPTITVDKLEVAQFIYLLLNNEKLRDVINTITTKAVLILGRFTMERKAILDAVRNELRKRDYLPVLFDFDKPAARDLTETITTLASMSRFIIADITDPKSIPQELESIVPDHPSVPVQPLLASSATEFSMFEHFKRFPWVLKVHRYKDLDDLLASLEDKVIAPAEAKAKEMQTR